MSYLPTGATMPPRDVAKVKKAIRGLTDAQIDAMFHIDPAEIRALDAETKFNLILQHKEQEVRRKEAFWNALQAFATAGIPILAMFGLTKMFGGR